MEQIAHSALRVRGERGYARIETASMPALLNVALLALSAANLVEPLSNGIRLSMTREEIIAKFGPPSEPTWDPRVFGYPQFVVEVGGVNQTIWRLVLKEGVSLSCGVRIGSSRQEVIRAFGAGDQVVHQKIRLRFAYRQNQLTRIEIEPAVGEFARSSNDSGKAPREAGLDRSSGSSFLGTWYGANVKIQTAQCTWLHSARTAKPTMPTDPKGGSIPTVSSRFAHHRLHSLPEPTDFSRLTRITTRHNPCR